MKRSENHNLKYFDRDFLFSSDMFQPWQVSTVKFDGHTFFPVAFQNKGSGKNPTIGLFVWILGIGSDARNYKVQMIFMESAVGNTESTVLQTL